MASVEHKAIIGVWAGPQRGPEAEPLVRGSGAKPHEAEAESFLRSGHTKEGANWPHVRVLNKKILILGKGALWARGKCQLCLQLAASIARFEQNWWSDDCHECHLESFLVSYTR